MAELEAKAAGVPRSAEPLQLRQSPDDGGIPEKALNIAGAAVEPNATMLTGSLATPVAGLAGILGGILPGPQGQSADWVRKTQSALTWQPQTEGGQVATDAISYPFRKFGELTNYLGENTAEATGSPGLGAVVKTVGDVGVPYAMSRALRAFTPGTRSPIASATTDKLARELMRKAMKPSATTPAPQVERALGTMLEEGISPTPGSMANARTLANLLHADVEAPIAASSGSVNIPRAAGGLRDLRNRAPTLSDADAVRAAWDDFRQAPRIAGKVDIPVSLAHQLKKDIYRSLDDKYGAPGSTATTAQKIIAAGLREQVSQKVPESVAPLKREAAIRNVLDVGEEKAMARANKNVLGLAPLGNSPAGIAAFLADRWTGGQAALARLLYQMGNPKAAQAVITSAGPGQIQEPDYSE